MAIRSLLYAIVNVAELVTSILVHLGYALWMFLTVLRMDINGFLFEENKASSAKVVPLMVSGFASGGKDVVEVPRDSERHNQTSAVGTFIDTHTKAPIVMIHGIFGFGKGRFGRLSYWAGAELKDDRVLVPDLGSLTSIHDRAVDLFYYLKGGTVDYGSHAAEKGHSRFGRTYEQGNYPEWDEHHPIHVIGHSTGVQVARCLQQLLADKAFPGHVNTTEDWVLSITSISGALNGTTRVHVEGIREDDGHTMQALCLIQFLRIAVLIYEWLDIPVLKKYYGFGFDHYDLSWRKTGIRGLISTMMGLTGPFAYSNWILPDLSIHSAIKFNSRVKTFPNTYYFSYATTRTRKFCGVTLPSTLYGIHPLLLLRTFQICLWRFKTPPYKGYRHEDWVDNDGALNKMSQLYPCFPAPHPHQLLGADSKDGQKSRPGIWYYTVLEADHITFILDRDRAGVGFDILYDSIFQRCRKQMQRIASSQHLQTPPQKQQVCLTDIERERYSS